MAQVEARPAATVRTRGATRLRQLLARPEILPTPLIHDALSARIAAAVGFEAVFLGGYGFSASFVGLPDAGFTSPTELLLAAQNIVNAVDVPVIVDMDTGFGNAISLQRWIRNFAQVGVAGVLLEDQVSPKRSEFVAGVQVIPIDEAVGKFRAAVDARDEVEPDFVIIARTDARVVAGGSVEEAIRRGNAYLAAGADVIFAAAPQAVDEIRKLMREIRGPAFCPVVGHSPYPSLQTQQEWGMAMTLYGSSQSAAARAIWDFYAGLRAGPTAQDDLTTALRGHPLENFHRFIGFADLQKREERYLPAEDLRRRYEGSIGFKG